MLIKTPLTAEQKESMSKPSTEAINKAADDMIMFLLNRVAELEAKIGDGD